MTSPSLQNSSEIVNVTDIAREINAPFMTSHPELNASSTSVPGEEQNITTTSITDNATVFSETTQNILHLTLIVVCFTVSLAGVITNIINMIVYNRYGLKEGMNMGFFSLAFSDFIVAITFLAGTACYTLAYVDPTNDVDPKSLLYLLGGSSRATFLGISAFTTGFISLERCVCVVSPLKVKILFSRKRSIIILISIYLFNILSYLPITLTTGLAWQFDPNLNRTRLLLKFFNHRDIIETATDIVNGALVPATVHVMVIASGVMLISRLRKAEKFRSTALSTRMTAFSISAPSEDSVTKISNDSLPKQNFDRNGKKLDTLTKSIKSGRLTGTENRSRLKTGSLGKLGHCQNIDIDENSATGVTNIETSVTRGESAPKKYLPRRDGNGNCNRKGMSRKDTNMVKIVATLVIIHVTCASPGLVYSFLRLCVSDLHLTKRLAEVYDLLFAIVFILEGINGFANMLVYYKISSRYRHIFTRTFLCWKTRES